MDSRFLAARFVIIFDTGSGQWGCEKLAAGASNKLCRKLRVGLLEGAGVDALISGSVDPISFRELGRNGIRIYEAPEISVQEAAEMLVSERLTALQLPDAVDVSRLPVKGRAGAQSGPG